MGQSHHIPLGGSSDSAKDASPDAPAAAGGAEPSPSASCSGLTQQEATEKWIGSVPTFNDDPGYAWVTEDTGLSGYDPCLPLSWITVGIKRPTGSSPYAVMLFHKGEFVRTATEKPQGFGPRVVRGGDDVISIGYTILKPDESTATASGRAMLTFTWDEASGSIRQEGTDPEDVTAAAWATPSPSTPAVNVPAGAYAGAGGPIPAGATPVTGVVNYQGHSLGRAIVTPSGNIGCDFLNDGGAGCGVQSYIESGRYRQGDSDPSWWFNLGGGVPKIGPKGDAPVFGYPGSQTVPYGTTVFHGDTVCHSAENGLTCWNVRSGHGVFMHRDGYEAF